MWQLHGRPRGLAAAARAAAARHGGWYAVHRIRALALKRRHLQKASCSPYISPWHHRRHRAISLNCYRESSKKAAIILRKKRGEAGDNGTGDGWQHHLIKTSAS